jgi:hypothetical protein
VDFHLFKNKHKNDKLFIYPHIMGVFAHGHFVEGHASHLSMLQMFGIFVENANHHHNAHISN